MGEKRSLWEAISTIETNIAVLEEKVDKHHIPGIKKFIGTIVSELSSLEKKINALDKDLTSAHAEVNQTIEAEQEYAEELNEDIELLHNEIDDIIKILDEHSSDIEKIYEEEIEYVINKLTEQAKEVKELKEIVNIQSDKLEKSIKYSEYLTGLINKSNERSNFKCEKKNKEYLWNEINAYVGNWIIKYKLEIPYEASQELKQTLLQNIS